MQYTHYDDDDDDGDDELLSITVMIARMMPIMVMCIVIRMTHGVSRRPRRGEDEGAGDQTRPGKGGLSRTARMKVAECLGQPHPSTLVRSQWPFGHTRPVGSFFSSLPRASLPAALAMPSHALPGDGGAGGGSGEASWVRLGASAPCSCPPCSRPGGAVEFMTTENPPTEEAADTNP